MAQQTIKMALAEMLEDLSNQNFDKFCHHLMDRRENPRVKRNRVEDKTRLDIADVLVSTFTESGALAVAVQILTEMDCNEEARRLVGQAGGR